MAVWLADLLRAVRESGRNEVAIRFFTQDGSRKEEKTFFPIGVLSEELVKKTARDYVAQLTAEDVATKLPPGPIDLTPPGEQEPTEAEMFQKEYHLLLSLRRGIEAEVLDAGDKQFTDQRALVQTLYKPEFGILL